jgi:hypothetical protein
MKHTHAAEDYANRSHKEFETVFTKFNTATYFNFNFNRNFNLILKLKQAVKWTI